MIAQTLRQTIRRRPFLSFSAAAKLTTTIGGLGYAGYREYNAKDDLSIIPRNYYDPNAIASYWEQRPISIMKRILSVAYELGPLAGEYVIRFHFTPWLCNSLNAGENEETTESKQSKQEELEVKLSQKLRDSLTKLGPTFVKVGQQLSIRPDLVSPIVLYELQRLCDAVPPFEDEIAMQVLAEELILAADEDTMKHTTLSEKKVNDTILQVFKEMPKLVASASLGQVYKATLRTNNEDSTTTEDAGQQVAIKVQRPDILSTVSLDLFLLVSYGKLVDKICSILTNQVPYHETFLNGFANGAFMELNYINEAENQNYFRNELHSRFHGTTKTSFLGSQRRNNVEKVIVPKVYDQFTSQRVLVSEWIDGIPLARAPPEQIRQLIPIGVELFLCQLLDIGRFHADPHPGVFIRHTIRY